MYASRLYNVSTELAKVCEGKTRKLRSLRITRRQPHAQDLHGRAAAPPARGTRPHAGGAGAHAGPVGQLPEPDRAEPASADGAGAAEDQRRAGRGRAALL